MAGYYTRKLSGEKLRRCYEVASPRVRRYLAAEIDFVRGKVEPGSCVLELGCGYGRVLRELAGEAERAMGIDSACESLLLAREVMAGTRGWRLAAMDAVELGFQDGAFDLVACLQNGIEAFRVDRRSLIREAVRVTRSGGRILLSTYCPRFWEPRLAWFRAQSAAGLVGALDEEATGDGVIACADGFRSGTTSPETFRSLTSGLGLAASLTEVDDSSLFCDIRVP
ncbi:MAG TPA: class I SAM-dependent methyltransferase [Thermoanaerobaculia bacterium]